MRQYISLKVPCKQNEPNTFFVTYKLPAHLLLINPAAVILVCNVLGYIYLVYIISQKALASPSRLLC